MDDPLVGLLFPPTRHQQTICVQAKTNGVRCPLSSRGRSTLPWASHGGLGGFHSIALLALTRCHAR